MGTSDTTKFPTILDEKLKSRMITSTAFRENHQMTVRLCLRRISQKKRTNDGVVFNLALPWGSYSELRETSCFSRIIKALQRHQMTQSKNQSILKRIEMKIKEEFLIYLPGCVLCLLFFIP